MLSTFPALAPTVTELGLPLRDGLAQLRRWSMRAVQLGATGPWGIRPRTLSHSEVRDIKATLRSMELQVCGIDLWIPPVHFQDPAHVDRALDAVDACCGLAGTLGCSSVTLDLAPPWPSDEILDALRSSAARAGVSVAVAGTPDGEVPHGLVRSLDPAAWLSEGGDPILAAADASASVRFSDLSAGVRVPPGMPGGRLDVPAFRAACSVGGADRPVIADLRWLTEPVRALATMGQVWNA